MVECKYYSFYALAKINDPELLYEAFQQQIAPGHADEIEVEVFEHSDKKWHRLTRSGGLDQNISAEIRAVLDQRFGAQDLDSWYYDSDIEGWFCSYRPLTSKHFVLLVKSGDRENLIEEDYLQFLFHFYCHQLQMLQGTYRDALTGLYNRRAFNEKMQQLLDRSSNHVRRAKNFEPTVYVMLDIDHFKAINDRLGHLFGDEVLLLLAQQMTESFRENDLLFRYGGEEFAMVLMDITPEQAQQSLQRFREKIAGYPFPNIDQVTVSIGFTLFDKNMGIDELIRQADNALYYCKTTTRNAVHSYQELVEQGLIPAVKTPKSPRVETS
ncbi:MAG: GGDEF domain-containing protein [Gammaproteobacteria bacterium]|nr:GGDEF domain-containing protein [Gammaproteobacteria bacterium]MDH3535369.1 GGDEF domain-containing protein [Gammaproteobacteria bacterium]